MKASSRLPILAAALAWSACLLVNGGCVSARYQTVRKPAAAVPLSLCAEAEGVTLVVNAVIVIRGPGSWKRDAYWDEYVVTVANRGDLPVTLQTAKLTGLAGETVEPGVNPWQIEKQSRTLADRNFGLLKDTAVHVGGGITAIGVGALALASGGTTWWTYGVLATGATIVTIPVFVGGSVYRNVHNRHKVEREFERRRLPNGIVLAPGQARAGSWFFPITPGPKTLALNLQTPEGVRSVTVDLASLAALHLARNERAAAK